MKKFFRIPKHGRVTKENIGKDLYWEFGSDCIGESVAMAFIFCNCSLVFQDLSFMFRNPVVNVLHREAIETFVSDDVVKSEDIKTIEKNAACHSRGSLAQIRDSPLT